MLSVLQASQRYAYVVENILGERRNQLSIILGDSKHLQEVLTAFAASRRTVNPEPSLKI